MDRVDSNCTAALRILPFLFHFAIQSGSPSWLPVNGSLFCRKHKEPSPPPPEVGGADAQRESASGCSIFPPSLRPLVFVIAACASAKLVNHFLFSLRTAVDRPERPLCAPSRPASQPMRHFDHFRCMFAHRRTVERRKKKKKKTLIAPTRARLRAL